MTDLFSEELSVDFVRNLLKDKFDWNCKYFLMTTPSGGFEIMSRNTDTGDEEVVLEHDDFESVVVDYAPANNDESAFYFSSDINESEESDVFDPSLDLTPTISKTSKLVPYLILALTLGLTITAVCLYFQSDTASVGQFILQLIEKLVRFFKGG